MSQKNFVYDPTASDKLSSVRGIGRYLQILKENFPDWTYINNETMKQLNNDCVFVNPFYNFLQRPLTLKRIAQKQIAVIHDLIPLKYPRSFPPGIKGSIHVLLNKLALRNYDLIITDSQASKADIINILKINSEKIKVIYPCLPRSFSKSQQLSSPRRRGSSLSITSLNGDNSLDSRLRGNDNFTINSKFCLYVGDATWNKNLVALARAIKIANVNCVFVGEVFQTSAVEEQSGKTAEVNNGWQSELKQFFKETINDKRFIFAGLVPDSELIKFYKQASINILPSRDEGFGFSYLESANFGCPSLLSNIPVLQEISDGKAIFFDQNDPQNIANKIKEINSDKNLRNKIGESAKKRSEFFSAEKFRKKFLMIINGI
ncbi:MAG: glycosyltransferase family 1 protein [Patescibacteria group bacterium]